MRVRTLFLSDIHLGFRRARVCELIEFLRGVEAECIVLAGDIVDALSLARRFFWADEHTQVLRMLLARRRAGTRLIYIPGNHDESLGMLAEMLHGQMEVHREWVYRTAQGQRLLVVHGDQFDSQVDCPAWLGWAGELAYSVNVAVSDMLNDVRRRLGRPYWPIAEKLKLALAASARYIGRFETAASSHARAQGFDGVICGHIHRAILRRTDAFTYANTGDWVESCSAIVETRRGELRLLRWGCGSEAALSATTALAADAA